MKRYFKVLSKSMNKQLNIMCHKLKQILNKLIKIILLTMHISQILASKIGCSDKIPSCDKQQIHNSQAVNSKFFHLFRITVANKATKYNYGKEVKRVK